MPSHFKVKWFSCRYSLNWRSQLQIQKKIKPQFKNNYDATNLWRRWQWECLKDNRFYEQNNSSTRASLFLYISLPSLQNDNLKWPNFELSWLENGNSKVIHFTIYLWTRTQCPLFSCDLTSLLSRNRVTWYKGKKVLKDENSLFVFLGS